MSRRKKVHYVLKWYEQAGCDLACGLIDNVNTLTCNNPAFDLRNYFTSINRLPPEWCSICVNSKEFQEDLYHLELGLDGDLDAFYTFKFEKYQKDLE